MFNCFPFFTILTWILKFNFNTSKNQQESLSISPENSGERVDCVAFVFMYGYNESEMPV